MATKVEGESRLRTKIIELKLKEEKEITDLAAIQEAETLRRDCASLREDVTRLEQDRAILRERGAKDREWINALLDQIGSKEREFNEKLVRLKVDSRDLERGQRESKERICELEMANRQRKDKCGWLEARLSRLAAENSRLAEIVKKEKELRQKFADLDSISRGVILEWKRKYEMLEARQNSRFVGIEMETRELESAKRMAEDEILKLKGKIRELEARLSLLVEIEENANKKFVSLELENVGLERAMKRAEDEANEWKKKHGEQLRRAEDIREGVDVWKKKCGELEGRVLVFEEGKMFFHRKETEFREKTIELECAKRKVDDEVNVWKKKCGELEGRVLVFEEEKMKFERKETEFRENTVELECAKRKADDEVDVWRKKCEKLEGRVLMLVEENSLLLETVEEGESKEKSVEPISSTNKQLPKRSSSNMRRGTVEDCRLDSGIRRKRIIEVVDEEDVMPLIQRRKSLVEAADQEKKASGSSCFNAHSGIPPGSLHSCDTRKFGGGRNLSKASKQHAEDSTQRGTEEDCLLDSEKRSKHSIEVVDIDNVGTACAYVQDEEDGPLIIHRRKKHVETANPGKSCKAHSQIPPASLQSCETRKYGR